jgi:hypothetical protein
MADYFAPMNNALAQYAMGLQYQDQQRRQGRIDEQAERRNAIAEQATMAQIAQMEQEQQRRMQIDKAFSGMFQPQRAAGTGPMRGVGNYQPGRMETTMPTYERAVSTLAPFGPEGFEMAQGFKGREPEYQIVDGQYVDKSGGGARPIPGFTPQEKKPLVDMSGMKIGDTRPKVGTIPPGFQLKETPQGYVMEPIPGGPVTREEESMAEKEKGRREQTARAGGTVIQDLQRAYDLVSRNRTAVGAPSLVTQFIPESDAQAAKGMIESALSNVGLDTLQTMRENSPTGGALGQVPIQQQKRLEQVLGSLDLSQRPEIVKDNLNRVINIYMDIVHGTPEEIQDMVNHGEISPRRAAEVMKRKPLSFDEFGNPVEKKPRRGSVEDGYRFIGGDPSDPKNWKQVR